METYNSEQSRKNQKEYCERTGTPHFAPSDGKCYRCNKDIYEATQSPHGNKTGITVGQSGGLITGCPHCHYSFCD